MKKSEKIFLLNALKGEAAAWRKLALQMGKGGKEYEDQELCRLLLNRAIELGDEESFFLYHQLFPREEMMFDDESYKEMVMEYLETKDLQVKARLKRYLKHFMEKQNCERI